YALSGMPPHGIGDVVSVVARAAAGRVEPLPPQVPAALVDLLDRMCAPDPGDRPTAVDLLPGPTGTVISPLAAAPAEPAPDPRDRSSRWIRPAAFALGSLALLLAGVGVGMAAAGQGGDGSPGSAAAETSDDGPTTEEVAVASSSTTSTTACVDRPYQPCDAPEPAPGTDG